MKITTQKIILSGDILEMFLYEKSLSYDFEQPKSSAFFQNIKTEEMKKEILKRSLGQTKGRLIRIINANARQWPDNNEKAFEPKFITLTFAENMRDLTEANHEYTNFLKNLNYYLTKIKTNHLKYVCVPEFQKRGAVHFHSIFFNLPWFKNDLLAEIWSNGFVKIREVSHIPNVGMYMAKYMTKEGLDERLQGRKRFFSSKNLNRPILIRNAVLVQKIFFIIMNIPADFSKTYESKYQGMTTINIYDLSKFPKIKENVLKSIARI